MHNTTNSLTSDSSEISSGSAWALKSQKIQLHQKFSNIAHIHF